MNFWEIVKRTGAILESEKIQPQFKRHGMMVYLPEGDWHGDIGLVQKCVLNWLSTEFQSMEKDEVLKDLKKNPDKHYESWIQYAKQQGFTEKEAFDFGWDWATSGEALTIPGRNLGAGPR